MTQLNKHILIVEDNPSCQLLTECVLESVGCSFKIALNGQEAVSMAKAETFDAILMDIRLPVLDGYSAAKIIREFDKAIPIIALTAHVMPWVKDKCAKSGMNAYLTKPFDQNVLLEILFKHLSSKEIPLV